MATTASENKKSIALLQKATYDSDNDNAATHRVVLNIKAAALMNPACKWEELLDCAPSAIYSMGCCYVVSSAHEAQNITLELKPGSSIQHESLRANLVRAGDMGFRAFNQADNGMDMIHQQSITTYNMLDDVAECIADPETGRTRLISSLSAIKRAATSCQTAAAAIHDKFEDWLTFMTDLHHACEEKGTKTSKELDKTTHEILMRTIIKKSQEEIVTDAKKDLERLQKKTALMEQKYLQACDAYPNQWDVFAQETLRGIVSLASTAAQGYLSMSTGGIFAAMAAGGIAAGVQPGGGMPGSAPGGAPGSAPRYAPGGAAQAQYNPMQELLESHCHSTIGVDMASISLLNEFLTRGPNDSPDWEKIKAEREKVQPNCHMLIVAGQEYPDTSGNTYDQKYLVLLKAVGEVAAWLSDQLEQASNMNWTAPEATDPTFVTMVRKLRTNMAAIQKIQNMVLALGGNAGAELPFVDDKPTSGSGSESYLVAAQHRLETTEAALNHASELYEHSLEAMAEKASRLAETEALLAQLSNSKLSLEQIKDIIRKSIEIIAELKEQTSNLNRFFERLARMIDMALQGPVTTFLDQVARSVIGQKDDDVDKISIGDFDMLAFRQTSLFHHIVNIRAYYSIFADVSAMWLKLSNESIQPGIHMCRQLSKMTEGSPADLEAKSRGLREWSSTARENVIKIATASQEEIKNHLDERLGKIQEVARQLVPSETGKTLKESAGETTKTIKEHINNANKPKVRKNLHL